MNVILIVTDTLRHDRLGCYGYRDIPTISPNIDNLAKNGILFENAFSNINCTSPAFTTILSGMHPISHTIITHKTLYEIPDNIVFLPEILQKHGIFTVAIDNLFRWFVKGFKYYLHPLGKMARKGGFWEDAEPVTKMGIKWLEKFAQKNEFFMMLHYWDPHTPYQPPKPFNKMYYTQNERDRNHPNKKSMEELKNKTLDVMFKAFSKYRGVNDINYFPAQYNAEITYMDHYIGKFIEKLEEMGILDDTILIFTADHGESMTEHDIYFTHYHLYEQMIHIPLIIANSEYDGNVTDIVRQVDLAPTILNFWDLPIPENFEGETLISLLLKNINSHPDSVLLFENEAAPRRGIRTKKWKYIRTLISESDKIEGQLMSLGYLGVTPKNIQEYELYDLENDIYELNNLADSYPDICDELDQKIESWVEKKLKKLGIEDPQKIQECESLTSDMDVGEWIFNMLARTDKFKNYLTEEQITEI